ncbi:YciI family protein [Allobranchiibius huperziae]|nr:YciI family protein [Allobranchiibius huperziae]
MEFFCFHRDRPGSGPLRRQILEQHWTYMDSFEDALRVRGPAFDAGDELVGSVHVVDLDGPAHARAFAFDEPSYQIGAYREVMLRRWHNALGRSMWEYPHLDEPEGLFLVMGFEPDPRAPFEDELPNADLVAFGHLLSDDGSWQLGTVAIVRAMDIDNAGSLLHGRGLIGVEAHGWTFGGRP